MVRLAVRVILILAAVAVAGWWLFWLTPSRGGEKRNELRFGIWGDYVEYRMWRRITDEFERANPGISVKIEYIPGGEYPRKLTAWMASDTSPDVMMLQDEPMPQYLAEVDKAKDGKGLLVILDLSDMIDGRRFGPELGAAAKDYWPSAWRSFGREEADGWHQYGLPIFGGCNLVFYNRDCFRRAGVELPEDSGIDANWTVPDFAELCRRLTLTEQVGGKTRVVQWGFNRPYSWLYWLPFIYACDAQILNDDLTEFVFTGPEALATLELWDRLRREGLTPRGADLGQMNENVAFLTGRVAMFTSGPWAMPVLNEAGVDYGVMFPPVSPTGRRGTRVTWDCVALAGRNRDNPRRLEMAYRFAHFVSSPRAAEIIAEIQRSIPANLHGRDIFRDGGEPYRSGKFIEGMVFARMQPMTVKWNDMDWALRDGLGKLTNGMVDPSKALEMMAQNILTRGDGGLFPVRKDGRLIMPGQED